MTELEKGIKYDAIYKVDNLSNKVEVQKVSNEGDYIGAKYNITKVSYAINDNFSLATNTNTYLTYDNAGVLLESIDFKPTPDLFYCIPMIIYALEISVQKLMS